MTVLTNLKKAALFCAAMAIFSLAVANANTVSDYKFKVHNNTEQRITKIMASPEGKKYGLFDIGKGIAPGATMELVWDKSTDNSNCEWFFKATFADGDVSEPVAFDFCEKDLVLEFGD